MGARFVCKPGNLVQWSSMFSIFSACHPRTFRSDSTRTAWWARCPASALCAPRMPCNRRLEIISLISDVMCLGRFFFRFIVRAWLTARQLPTRSGKNGKNHRSSLCGVIAIRLHYYSRTRNMDKWQNPVPCAIGFDQLVLVAVFFLTRWSLGVLRNFKS